MTLVYSPNVSASWIFDVHWVNRAVIIAVLSWRQKCSIEKSLIKENLTVKREMFQDSFAILIPQGALQSL